MFDKTVLITTRIPRDLYDQIVLLAYQQGDGNVDKLMAELLQIGVVARKGPDADGDD